MTRSEVTKYGNKTANKKLETDVGESEKKK